MEEFAKNIGFMLDNADRMAMRFSSSPIEQSQDPLQRGPITRSRVGLEACGSRQHPDC